MAEKGKKLLVAMSGGVDSSAALRLLKDDGFDCTGVTFVTDSSEESEKACRDAAAVAEGLGVPHTVLDVSREFDEKVKEYFVRTYEEGGTPNPCVVCNREIKFGLLGRCAAEHGFDGIATGHYARLVKENGRVELHRALDAKKDQSYMLAGVPESALEKAIFPLGGYTKEEIRRIAADAGIVTAEKKDSQDICFVPDGDYAGFIERFRGKKIEKGVYVDADGRVLGENLGQAHYTVGQRKGLGIALGRHMFVLSKDAETNTVVLGDEDGLFRRTLTAKDLNLIGVSEEELDGATLDVKIRYAHRGAPAKVELAEGGRVKVTFEEPQRAPSRGQLAVFYRGTRVLGSAVIE